MPRNPLPITNFQTPDGNPVANGYLLIRLNTDGNASSEQIHTQHVRIPLDSSGNIIGSPVFWTNASISPPGTYYIYEVYEFNGQLVSGPNMITV